VFVCACSCVFVCVLFPIALQAHNAVSDSRMLVVQSTSPADIAQASHTHIWMFNLPKIKESCHKFECIVIGQGTSPFDLVEESSKRMHVC